MPVFNFAYDFMDQEFRKGKNRMVCLCRMMSVSSAETSQRLQVTRWAGDWNHLEAYLLTCLVPGTEDWKAVTANWNTSMWLGFLTAWQP